MGSTELCIFSVFLICMTSVDGYRNYRHSGPEVGQQSAAGPEMTSESRGSNDCPLQCRCIALSHLSYRHMAERWMSMGRLHGSGSTIWKGTEAPIWRQEPETLNGRDVVCMGLNKIPRPLPNGVTKLTLFGDSSDIRSDGSSAQLTSLRENAFVNGADIRELTISGNDLTILYPFIFRNLPSMEYLALQNNNVSHISAATFSSLGDLKELRLSDNMIRFLSPNVFNKLTLLEFLYLNGNKLSILSANLFRNLKQLEYLDLSRNNFRSFSDSVFDDIVNLKELFINENQIFHIRARWFKNLSQLRTLEIRANTITRIDPSSFKELSSLERLSLSANVINTVSNEAFRNLSMLQVLDIGTNDINTLEPDCFAGLDSLDTLDLSMNHLFFINNKTFTATPTLRKLDLSKNSIKDIEEAALHPLAALEELDLSNNKLKKVKGKTFTGLMELKELNLEHNIISEVENDAFIVAPLNQLSKITWLSLQYNRIKTINTYSLFGLPHMKFLNIGHNKLKTIHKKAFKTLSSLQNLLLNNNKIKSLADGTFATLKLLYSLNLEKNKLTVISNETFLGLKNLDDLNLVSNAIESISSEAFIHFSKLKRLDLNTNLLSTFSFKDLTAAKELTYVDLSKNRLYKLQFPETHTHDIRQLLLSENRLQTLSSDVIAVMAAAGNVWLKDNPWSCDCRLDWIKKLTSQYRIRLLGSRDTVCKTPARFYGQRLTNLETTDFRCDNLTVSQTLTCQNLQVKYSIEAQVQSERSGKQAVARQWHVTFRGENDTTGCSGIILNKDWALLRSKCARALLSPQMRNIVAVVGRKETRQVAMSVDYQTESSIAEFDLRLVRFVSKKSKTKNLPCILTHSQYYELSYVHPEGFLTMRTYQSKKNRWKLIGRRGKIPPKCENDEIMCMKLRGKGLGADLQGSPMSIQYQGIWYLAGLGETFNSTSHHQTFTPLWSVTDWIATTMHEIDSKCQFQRDKGKARVLCENLQIEGAIIADSDQIVSV